MDGRVPPPRTAVADASFFANFPVDVLGDVGAYLRASDRRSLAGTTRGLRHAALSLWANDMTVHLKRDVLLTMAQDPAFARRVREALLGGPLPPLPIRLTVEHCCELFEKEESEGPADEGYPAVTYCEQCRARAPFPPLPPGVSDLSFADGFHRVDLLVCRELVRDFSPLRAVSTLVLFDSDVRDLSCLSQCQQLRELAVSLCRRLEVLPHVPSLQRVELRCCPKVKSVEAFSHVRSITMEGCEEVRDVSALSKVHTVALERRLVLTDVSALLLGGVHALVLDVVAIRPLPAGGRVHTLTMTSVFASERVPRVSDHYESYSKASPGCLTGVLRRRMRLHCNDDILIDLSLLHVRSLSLCAVDARGGLCEETTQFRGLDALLPKLEALVTTDRRVEDFASLAHLRSLTLVLLDIEAEPDMDRGDDELDLSALVRVPRLRLFGTYADDVHGLLPALGLLMRENPADVRVQRHGCAAAVNGGPWAFGGEERWVMDKEYTAAIYDALSAYPSDHMIARDGLLSLDRTMPPFVAEAKTSPALLRYLDVARSFLERADTSAAVVAAALYLMDTAIVRMRPELLYKEDKYLAMFSITHPVGRQDYERARSEVAKASTRTLLSRALDDATDACMRAVRAWPDNRTVFPAAASLFAVRVAFELAAVRKKSYYEVRGHRIPSDDRTWLRPAIRTILTCVRHSLVDRVEPTAEILSYLSDLADLCPEQVANEGGVDLIVAWGNEVMRRPRADVSPDDPNWLSLLVKFVPLAASSGAAPPLLQPSLFLDIARRLVRWSNAGGFGHLMIALLGAGERDWPSSLSSEAIKRALLRHSGDYELVEAALRDAGRDALDAIASEPRIREIVVNYVACAPRPNWARVPTAVVGSAPYRFSIGLKRGGLARFASAVFGSWVRDDEGRVSWVAETLLDALCVYAINAEEVGTAEDVNAALRVCTECLEKARLWEDDENNAYAAIGRVIASLLRWKFHYECGQFAPSLTALCALSAAEGIGMAAMAASLLPAAQEDICERFQALRARATSSFGVNGALNTAWRFLACVAQWASEAGVRCADFEIVLPTGDPTDRFDELSRTILIATARCGFVQDDIRSEPSLERCAVTFFALCALTDRDRHEVLSSVSDEGIDRFRGMLTHTEDEFSDDNLEATVVSAVHALFENMRLAAARASNE